MAQLSDDCFAFGGSLLGIDAAREMIFQRVQPVDGIERVPLRQEVLEVGISARPAEYLPHLVEVVRQDLAGEIERERLAEVEFSRVRYREVFLVVTDIFR